MQFTQAILEEEVSRFVISNILEPLCALPNLTYQMLWDDLVVLHQLSQAQFLVRINNIELPMERRQAVQLQYALIYPDRCSNILPVLREQGIRTEDKEMLEKAAGNVYRKVRSKIGTCMELGDTCQKMDSRSGRLLSQSLIKDIINDVRAALLKEGIDR